MTLYTFRFSEFNLYKHFLIYLEHFSAHNKSQNYKKTILKRISLLTKNTIFQQKFAQSKQLQTQVV